MAGYIDNSAGEALWSSYNGGRAASGAAIPTVHHYAQWSAVIDSGTCDWCKWADERIFDTDKETYNPPVHWGCRCLIGHIKRDEPKATLDWGKGPPDSAWPPGTKGGMKKGKPTLSNVPPKNKKPISKALDWVADSWKKQFSNKFARTGNATESRYASTYMELQTWERNALRELMDPSLTVSQKNWAIERMDSFIGQWTSASDKRLKGLAEVLARGSEDDLVRYMWGGPGEGIFGAGEFTAFDGKGLISAWDAHKSLAAETMKRSNMVRDGKVTVYRGTHARRPASKAFKEAVEAGDLEQVAGSDFMSSWTVDEGVAHDFAGRSGMVFKKEIDAEDVFAHWQEHPGFQSYLEESEVMWYNWDGTLVPKKVTKADPQIYSSQIRATVVEVF